MYNYPSTALEQSVERLYRAMDIREPH
ncbi:MAG: hypothetical protein K0R28_1008, partial [Paenibacillus sp.]|nr:hypothetical protein [Paenibacillus sp.]